MSTAPRKNGAPQGRRPAPGGIRRTLLRSHLAVGLLGVGILLIGLGSSLWIRNNTLRLAIEQGPTAQYSTRVLAGVQQSGAALRAWMLLGDPDAKRARVDTWRHDIGPAIQDLRQLSDTWTNEGDRDRLNRLISLLAELRTWQWSIEDVSQTPGNRPAQVSYLQTVEPVVDLVTKGITALLALETATTLGDRTSLTLIADVRHAFTAGETALQDFLDTGDTTDESRYRMHLEQTLGAMTEIRERRAMLTRDQQDVLEWLDAELSAYPRLVDSVIAERHDSRADLARYWLTAEAQPRASLATTLLLESVSADQSALMQREATRVSSLHNTVIAVALLLIVATIFTVWIVSKQTADQLTRPIAALATATDELADGQLTRDLPVTTSDELGALTQSFNTMRAALDPTADEAAYAPDRESYLGRPRRLATQQPGTTPHDSALPQPPPQSHTDASDIGALNWQHALDSVDGDTERLKQTITGYLDASPGLRAQLRTAIAQGDAAVVRHAAQTIRGGLDCFGVPRAAALADRLEEAGRRGWMDSAAEQCVVLEEELDAIEPELQAFLMS